MTCDEVLDLVEAIAAGDVTGDVAMRAHVENCSRCAAALASARRIHTVLAAGTIPAAPARFTADVLARIRRERWRSEQQVDRIFNVAIVAALFLVVGGVAALMNLSTVMSVVANAWRVLAVGSEQMMQAAAPRLATYLAAAGLLCSALVMWWWAERQWEW